MADTFEEAAADAKAAASEYQAAEAGWQKDPLLSVEGKQQAIERAKAAYQAKFGAIRERTERALSAERDLIGGELGKIRAGQAKAEREAVGPEIQYRLIERRLAAATPAQLVEEVKAARDPWEKAVIGRLAATIMPEPTSSEDGDTIRARSDLGALLREQADPTAARLEGALAHVESGLGSLGRLDPIGWRQGIVQRYGLRG